MPRSLTRATSVRTTRIVRDGTDEGDAFVAWLDNGMIGLGRRGMFRHSVPAEGAALDLITKAPEMTEDEFEAAFDAALAPKREG